MFVYVEKSQKPFIINEQEDFANLLEDELGRDVMFYFKDEVLKLEEISWDHETEKETALECLGEVWVMINDQNREIENDKFNKQDMQKALQSIKDKIDKVLNEFN